MTCPVCGGDTKINDSRSSGERLRRRRECLKCGHRFTTIEVDADYLEKLEAIQKKAVSKHAADS